ncbi:3-deoxy-D-manno-octulosonic acid kinase [Marinobacter sp. F4218]|uniref:3-deoxy-D-manno-octulosonic acid kinase n=1 Tax=Marinobacter sp. F4218 TaxID=2862868 RepID=UPI001C638F63|nr:3-deoxy-D-manno-octulosonic acid kinase [Marinobacter sp. F4218]MBW7473019.1 3-deoxy-D-manno-octulosonic acid kinase [Marinobacter sp. F4218]
MVESEICERRAGSGLLIHPDYEGRVTVDWFDPDYWGAQAQSVSSGGRGAAWFIDADGSRLVLREYRRGGLVARLSERAYFYTREQDVRSFSEFRLLNQLHHMGLPVPKAVAAWYRKVSPVQYQAAIIIERLDETVPLAELITQLQPDDWYSLGQTIRRFHDAGVRHADLNCFNVLVKGSLFYLIDFDKGQIRPSGSASNWKNANLERFARSLRKVAGEAAQQKVWDAFMNGYNGSQSA